MAGHSKWANIKHRKGAQDAKRGKIFTKLIKEITVASKEGSPDPDMNPRLRLAIQNAKGANMPKDTIERAIKKGQGGDALTFHELTYEGYAPNGVAVFVECATDNLNRTIQSVRSIFNKNGGNLGKNGSLEFIFDRKGVFTFPIPENFKTDELTLELIDGGAEDVEFEEELAIAYCEMADFGLLQRKLEEIKIEIQNADLQRIPNTSISVNDSDFIKIMKLIDKLEDDDDVQKVYHNLEVNENQIKLLE